MSLLALIATVTLITFTSANKFCCAPDKYTADTLIKFYVNEGFYQGKGRFYVDNGMAVSFSNITISESKGVYSIVRTFYSSKSGNLYRMTGKVCRKENLDKSKIINNYNCIPDDAVLASSVVVGGHHEDIEVNKYIKSFALGQVEMVVTKHHCYPVNQITLMYNQTKKGSHVKEFAMVSVANVKLSIDDPSVFVLPDACKKAHLSTERNINNDLPVDPWKSVPFLGRV